MDFWKNKKLTTALFGLIAFVYLLGAWVIDILEIDAAQYASISLEMLKNKSFLQVYHRGSDYLDKPPLLFWLGTLSYQLFGINHFAYRLPTIFSTALGAFATYKLAKKLYSKETGVLAALILASSQAFFLHNHDVRTDTLVTNFAIFTIWQLYEYLSENKWKFLFGGFTGIALAMLSKGPIGIMVPLLAIGTHLLYQQNWKAIFKWQWLIGIAWTLLLLSPMLWGLYTQYGWDGPYFFFWLQSFGRLTGENVWDNNPDPFFLYHSFLWEFLPWALIAYYGVFKQLFKALRYKTAKSSIELITIGGIILPFLALSQSHFQLPHYILVVFPLAAIISAKTILEINQGRSKLVVKRLFSALQWFTIVLLFVAAFLLLYFVFPSSTISLWAILLVGTASTLFFIIKGQDFISKAIIPSALAVITVNIILNLHFYPNLATYQAGKQIANYIERNDISKNEIYFTGDYLEHSAEFYSRHHFHLVSGKDVKKELANHSELWLCADKVGLEKLDLGELPIVKIEKINRYPVTLLTAQFLNPKTRNEVLETFYILHLKQ